MFNDWHGFDQENQKLFNGMSSRNPRDPRHMKTGGLVWQTSLDGSCQLWLFQSESDD